MRVTSGAAEAEPGGVARGGDFSVVAARATVLGYVPSSEPSVNPDGEWAGVASAAKHLTLPRPSYFYAKGKSHFARDGGLVALPLRRIVSDRVAVSYQPDASKLTG